MQIEKNVRSRIARAAAGAIIALSPILATACNAQPRPVPRSESGGLPGASYDGITDYYPEAKRYLVKQAITFGPENNPNHPLVAVYNFTDYTVDGQRAKETFEYFDELAAKNIGISWENQGYDIEAVLSPHPFGQQKRVVALVPRGFPTPAWTKTDFTFFTHSFDQPERLRYAVIKVDNRDYDLDINYGIAGAACFTAIKAELVDRDSIPDKFTLEGEKIDQEGFAQAVVCGSLGASFYYKQKEFTYLYPFYRFAIGMSPHYALKEYGFVVSPQMYEEIPNVGNVIVSP